MESKWDNKSCTQRLTGLVLKVKTNVRQVVLFGSINVIYSSEFNYFFICLSAQSLSHSVRDAFTLKGIPWQMIRVMYSLLFIQREVFARLHWLHVNTSWPTIQALQWVHFIFRQFKVKDVCIFNYSWLRDRLGDASYAPLKLEFDKNLTTRLGILVCQFLDDLFVYNVVPELGISLVGGSSRWPSQGRVSSHDDAVFITHGLQLVLYQVWSWLHLIDCRLNFADFEQFFEKSCVVVGDTNRFCQSLFLFRM